MVLRVVSALGPFFAHVCCRRKIYVCDMPISIYQTGSVQDVLGFFLPPKSNKQFLKSVLRIPHSFSLLTVHIGYCAQSLPSLPPPLFQTSCCRPTSSLNPNTSAQGWWLTFNNSTKRLSSQLFMEERGWGVWSNGIMLTKQWINDENAYLSIVPAAHWSINYWCRHSIRLL